MTQDIKIIDILQNTSLLASYIHPFLSYIYDHVEKQGMQYHQHHFIFQQCPQHPIPINSFYF